jgi:TolB-like protein/tetratricopeptide (TPR) repeat protein
VTLVKRPSLHENEQDPGVALPVTDPSHAVFLSYASEDAAAAERIATALRNAGVEVWFDKSELRGGDAWDRMIRQHIRDCALFVPLISANTQARLEGYFRLEWRLGVERSHLMADAKPFLIPVVVDATSDKAAEVPDSFRAVQWTRLPGGDTPAVFVERIQGLLSGEASVKPQRPAESASVPIRRPLSTSSKRILPVVVALALVAVVAYLAVDKPWRSMHAPAPSVAPAASIAVLPLANESGDANQQYFSDGISEDLITALGQFPGLKVIGRTSAFQFRDSKEDSRSIGAKLGVAHLLEGSVQRAGDMVRVSAELIDSADGSTQWSERYDRPYKDLFALQDEITGTVVGALRAKLLPGENTAEQSDRPPGGSLEAYNALLQGQFYFSSNTEADLRKAIEFYTQATELDPHYALAWTGLSLAWSTLAHEFLEYAPAREAFTEARAAAARALTLAPNLAPAHLARGHVLLTADFDWRGAEAEYRRALELAPNNASAKSDLARVLATIGQTKSAIELTRQALATEPLQANWYFTLATYLSGINRLDEAERAIRRAIELQPAASSYYVQLTIIEIQRGDAQAALAAAQKEPPGYWQDIAIAFARQIGGDKSAADTALKTLIKKDTNFAVYQIADVYALRNDAKATFEWLDRAWSSGDSGIRFLFFDPFILRYKNDPRFAAFCRKVGLPVPGEAPAGKST